MVAIAQVVESFAYGTAKSVLQLCELFGPEDQVSVFYGRRQGTEVDVANLPENARWIPLPGEGKRKHLTNIKFLRKQLQHGFDVVHGHSAFGGLYAKVVGPTVAKKTLYSPRGYSFLREDFPAPARWMFRQIEKHTASRCTTVCCGPYEHELATALGGKSIRINNGFSVEEPRPVASLDNYSLGVGRICHQKGFDIFAETARCLPNQKFIWVGEIQHEDNSLINDLPANVQLIPYINHHDLLEMIRCARTIFLPSRWEGLSRFLIESVCLGKAVVTSHFRANLDCLQPVGPSDFSNGFACSTVEDYRTAVETLGANDRQLNEMQWASFNYASQNFDIERITEQWRRLYREKAKRDDDSPVGSPAEREH